MAISSRWYLLVFFSLFFAGLGHLPLTEPDEGRYLEIPREMLLTGDFVLPRLNGVLYFEKPPLYYWLNAFSIKLFGLNAFAARFWNALFGFLGLFIAWFLGKTLYGEKTGIYSALIIGTTPLYLFIARTNIIDMTLSFFLNLTLFFFWFGYQDTEASRKKIYWNAMFVCAALTVLAKGLIGIVLPGAIISLYILLRNEWGILKKIPWLTGLFLFFIIVLPWHVLAAKRDPDFLYFYLIREHFLRYATSIAKRQEPFWFFVPVLIIGFLPWTGLLFSWIHSLKKNSLASLRENKDTLFLSLWFGVIFLFFSLSKSKLIPYILPCVLPLSVLLAQLLEKTFTRQAFEKIQLWGNRISSFLILLFGLAGIYASLGILKIFSGFDTFNPALFLSGTLLCLVSSWLLIRGGKNPGKWLFLTVLQAIIFVIMAFYAAIPIAEARTTQAFTEELLRSVKPEARLYGYHYYPQTVPVYSRRFLDLAEFRGELEFGISKLSPEQKTKRFPSIKELKTMWDSDETVYLIVKDTWMTHLEKEKFDHYKILFNKNSFYLISNQK
jgi:hypothetical protein